ncbi:MAG: hypothetical protein QXL77_07140 [Candidatus Bathyarchaeia archaeon]
MDTKKLMATFAILIIALGIAGFAYAHWTATVYIEGEITTGYLDLEWSFEGELIQTKPVAELDYEIEDGCLWVNLTNVYPCLTVNMTIDVTNTGTIPVKLYDWDWGLEEGSDNLLPWIKVLKCEFIGVDGNGDGVPGSIEQLDPGDSVVLWLTIHFEQEDAQGNVMPQNAWMGFWAWFEWVNWNA